jgi:hypothetical protein
VAPRTSSADPSALSQYAADGTALARALQTKAAALVRAAGILAVSGESVPGLDDLVTAFGDLAADWAHLDAHAGDVAAGFLAALGPDRPAGPSPSVVTVDDRTLADLGRVGTADRDRAIVEAAQLAAAYRQLGDALAGGDPLVWDPPGDGGVPIETMERLAAVTEAHRYDPAFAVAFAEAMGVDGMVGLRGLHRSWAREARDADRPRGVTWTEASIDAWADAQMAGAAGVLTTAMGTVPGPGRHHTGDGGPAAAGGLDDAWVRRFAGYDGEAQVDYSLIVRAADLPAEVLVAVGDDHLGEYLGGDGPAGPAPPGGLASPARTVPPEAAVNIAAAMAADADAAVAWLSSDGIEAGTDNVALVLAHGNDVDVYARLVDVVETGLTHPTDVDGRGALMEASVRAVGDHGGGVAAATGADVSAADEATSGMHVALARGAAANMDVLDRLVNDGWAHGHLGGPPPTDTYLAHDFLREVMADAGAAQAVAGGYEAHAIDGLRNLPPAGPDGAPGDGLSDRGDALQRLGAVEGVIIHAENNALLGSLEEHLERQRSRAAWVDRGVDGAAFAAGLHPIAGAGTDAIDGLAAIAGITPGGIVFPADDATAALDEATADARRHAADANVNFCILIALADGAESPPVASVAELDDTNRQAFVDWVLEHYDEASHFALEAGFENTGRWLEDRR